VHVCIDSSTMCLCALMQVFEQEVEGLGPTAPLAQPEALQRQLVRTQSPTPP
jgi:hypothetical protein